LSLGAIDTSVDGHQIRPLGVGEVGLLVGLNLDLGLSAFDVDIAEVIRRALALGGFVAELPEELVI
jgi:hypothetical protein